LSVEGHKARLASVLAGEMIPEPVIEGNVKYPYSLDSVPFTTLVPRELFMMLETRGTVDHLTTESKNCVYHTMKLQTIV
jgi:hypothetical protein